MYMLLPADESANLGARLQTAMKRHSSLWVSLFAAYGGSFVFAVRFLSPFVFIVFIHVSGGPESGTGSPGVPATTIVAIVAIIYY